MYEYQKSSRYFAQVADDIKDLARDELLSLGAHDISPVFRGIHFSAGAGILYSANLQTRLINRILAPLVSFNCHSDRYLYKQGLLIPWDDFLDVSDTFAVFATVSHSNIRHSKFAALRLKDAIADYFRERSGKRPSVDTKDPDVWFNLHIENNEAVISLDTSGGSLHRRGYRRRSVEAPMLETLAAAIIRLSEWNGQMQLYDPFCGSGTLLCEAYLAASNTPAGFMRQRFGFEKLPDFDTDLWHRVRTEAMEGITVVEKDMIAGSDISQKAAGVAGYNCALIDQAKKIEIEKRDIFDIAELNGRIIVANPPYGIRLNDDQDLSGFYKRFGDFLKQRCMGSTAYIYFGDRKYLKHIGLRPSWKKILSNGGLDGRLAKFELY